MNKQKSLVSQVRERYNLSLLALEKITGIRTPTLLRYERRNIIPNKPNRLLLEACLNPFVFESIVYKSKALLTYKQVKHIEGICADTWFKTAREIHGFNN